MNGRIFQLIAGARYLWLWLCLALLVAAEALIAFNQPVLGLGLHAMLLLALTMYAGLGREEVWRKLALALVLVPLVRVLSLTLPLALLPAWAWYAAVAGLMLLAVGLALRQLSVSRRELGLASGMPLLQFMLMGGGLGLGYVEYTLLPSAQPLNSLAWNNVMFTTLASLVWIGLFEEFIFRGLLQAVAVPALGRWALVYVALLFAAMHLGFRSLPVAAFALGIGVLFGYVVRWGGSLLGVAVAHGLANVTAAMLGLLQQQRTSLEFQVALQSIIGASSTLAILAVLILAIQQLRGGVPAPVPTASAAPQGALVNMRTVRRGAGMTYSELASRTGIPARQLAEIEYGQRPLEADHRLRISRALGVDSHALAAGV